MNVVVVIPARMASTRCPGKPLRMLAGKPMVQWVYEAALKAALPRRVLIATPDAEIVAATKAFGGEGILTSSGHSTGTDRIAEVASKIDADVFVNVQGDEPLIDPVSIDACAKPVANGESEMASVYDWADEADLDNPNVVKVVTSPSGMALYFSRSRIPFVRSQSGLRTKKHVGLYAYTGAVLSKFAGWDPTPLEKTEVLEQLRFLENGIAIKMSYAPGTPLAVDTPAQADEAARLLAARSSAV
ncbi:MAG: 3-deoxy-manno-octulosonate cytidylyltransferase [Armatimonadota bacterium]|nr:3-deoxy-manno-octulosonate cytidylyltransferase [Armatimonadota bacterium]